MTEKTTIKITKKFKNSEYDEFTNNNLNTSVFQTRDIAEVYEKYASTDPLILVAKKEESDEILATMLAKKLSEKNGLLSSFSSHSTIRGGPLFKDSEDGIKAVSQLLQEYNHNIADKWGILYTRIYPLFDTKQIVPSYQENYYDYSNWNNFVCNLNRPLEDVWRDLDKSRRKNINRAMNRGVYVEEIIEKSDIQIFYNLLLQNYNNRKQPLEDINYFKQIFDILVPKGIAKFFVAKYKDEWAAVRLFLAYKGVVYDWYTAASPDLLSLYPNDLLAWRMHEWGVENGFSLLDFGGAGTPEQASEGWVIFKQRFGGNHVNYGRFTKVHRPETLWIAKKGFNIYNALKFR